MTTDPRQLTLTPSPDPTGHPTQLAVQLLLQRDAGPVQPNVYLVQHGGQRLKIVIANAPAGLDTFFELDAAGHVLVEYA